MVGKYHQSYQLPESTSTLVELVKSVPSDWRWINGILIPTQKLYDEGRIAGNTRFYISGDENGRLVTEIIGIKDIPFEEETEFSATMQSKDKAEHQIDKILAGKLYSSVEFGQGEALLQRGDTKIELLKNSVINLLNIGYKGKLGIVRRYSSGGITFNIYGLPMEWFVINHFNGRISLDYNVGAIALRDMTSGTPKELEVIIKKLTELGIEKIEE